MSYPDLLLAALVLAAPLAAIYLADQLVRWVERNADKWLDYLAYARLRMECWWANRWTR